MGLAQDEPKANDEKIEAEGLSFIMASEVADTIRSYGGLFIDYMEQPWKKGFELSLQAKVAC